MDVDRTEQEDLTLVATRAALGKSRALQARSPVPMTPAFARRFQCFRRFWGICISLEVSPDIIIAMEMPAYEGAVDVLDRRGIIDRQCVGLIGFSRTVYHVAYALTHSKYIFRGAILADGIDGGYLSYLLWPTEDSPRVNGGEAFGPLLANWLRNSPGFDLDGVTVPVHLEYYGRASFLGGWQWYSGLSLVEKPVDHVWLPHGTHLLVKPSERLASQQGTVDWFRFWLLGEEDSDLDKRERYRQWERLRELESRDSKPRQR